MSKRSKPARWRIWSTLNPVSYALFRNGKRLATAQKDRNGKWFVYGQGFNTARYPVDTLDDAKHVAKVAIS